jgi:hypothetical protein
VEGGDYVKVLDEKGRKMEKRRRIASIFPSPPPAPSLALLLFKFPPLGYYPTHTQL